LLTKLPDHLPALALLQPRLQVGVHHELSSSGITGDDAGLFFDVTEFYPHLHP
jgi:hypothetical protein